MSKKVTLMAALIGCCLLVVVYLAVRAPKREVEFVPGHEQIAGVEATDVATLAVVESAQDRVVGRSQVESSAALSVADIFDEISASVHRRGCRTQVRFRVVDAVTGEVPGGLVLRQLGRKSVDINVVPANTAGDCIVESYALPGATLELRAPGFVPEGRRMRSSDWRRDFVKNTAVIDLGLFALSKSRVVELKTSVGLEVEQAGERWQLFVYDSKSRDLSSRVVLSARTSPRGGVRCELSEQDCGKMVIAAFPGGVAQARLRIEDWATQELVLEAVRFDRFEFICVVPPGADPAECRVRVNHVGGIGAALYQAESTDAGLAELLGIVTANVKTGVPHTISVATSIDTQGDALHLGLACTVSSEAAGLRGGLRLDRRTLKSLTAEPQIIQLVLVAKAPFATPRDQTLSVVVEVLDAETGRPVAGTVTVIAKGRVATLSGHRVVLSVPQQGTLFGVVKARGYIQKRLEVDADAIDESNGCFTVYLRAFAETLVRVVDQGGAPVVGVMFAFNRELSGGVGFQCRTDDAGVLRLKEVGRGERLLVAPPERLRSNGLLRSMEPTSVVGGVMDQVLRVKRDVGAKPVTVHATLSGHDIDSGYLAKCAVMSVASAGGRRPKRLFKGAQVVLSGATAIIHGLSHGDWVVALESSGGDQGLIAFTVRPGASEWIHVDCEVSPPARIAGKVEAQIEPRQMRFLRVMCVSTHIWGGADELNPQPYMLQDTWKLSSESKVSASGEFAFDDLPSGDYMLQIIRPPGITCDMAMVELGTNGSSVEGVVIVAVVEAVVEFMGIRLSPIAELVRASERGPAGPVLEVIADGVVIRSWSGSQLRDFISRDGEPLSVSPGAIELRLRRLRQTDATQNTILWSATRRLIAGERWGATGE